MTRTVSLHAIMLAAVLLSGCATTSAERICTAEWIGQRADRAVAEIERDTSRAMRAITKAGESWSRGKTPGPLTMLSLSRSLKSLERELTDGRGVRDLKTLARTCDDPMIVARGLDLWLEDQGLPSGLVNFIRDAEILSEIARLTPDEPA